MLAYLMSWYNRHRRRPRAIVEGVVVVGSGRRVSVSRPGRDGPRVAGTGRRRTRRARTQVAPWPLLFRLQEPVQVRRLSGHRNGGRSSPGRRRGTRHVGTAASVRLVAHVVDGSTVERPPRQHPPAVLLPTVVARYQLVFQQRRDPLVVFVAHLGEQVAKRVRKVGEGLVETNRWRRQRHHDSQPTARAPPSHCTTC